MKKLLVLTALLSFLLPTSVKAESKAYECLESKDFLVARQDAYTVFCYNGSNLNNKTTPSASFYLIKWDNQAKPKYLVMTTLTSAIKSNQSLILIFEKTERTSFLLIDRQFQTWLNSPNDSLVNRHREDITLLLNAYDKYVKLSGEQKFKKFKN